MLYCIHSPHGDRPFFGFPKVHKDRSHWAHGIPPLRPIISDCPMPVPHTSRGNC
jgi:hypothetical protein